MSDGYTAWAQLNEETKAEKQLKLLQDAMKNEKFITLVESLNAVVKDSNIRVIECCKTCNNFCYDQNLNSKRGYCKFNMVSNLADFCICNKYEMSDYYKNMTKNFEVDKFKVLKTLES